LICRAIPPDAALPYDLRKRSIRADSCFAQARMKRVRPIMRYTLHINGKLHTVDVDSDTPLLWVLRDAVNLKGTKFSCGEGLCGACTVHLDGAPVRSCLMTVSEIGSASVTTIEGIGDTPVGAQLQRAWVDVDVVQCGYCQAGQIMAAAALLAKTKTPSDADIESAMDGNICRCGTYTRIREAIKQAANTDFGSPATRKGP
jgi:isoquinoline 1-oxidoreductase alpha subunit